jgi:hypothetical protein
VSARAAGRPLSGVAAAAFAGGFLAALVLETKDSVRWPVLGVLILGAVVFCVLAVATFAPGAPAGRRPEQQFAGPPTAADRRPAVATAGRPAPAASGTSSRDGWASAAAVPRWRPPTTASSIEPEAGPPAAGPDRQPVNVAVPVPGGAWRHESTSRPSGRKSADPAGGEPDRLDPAATTRIVQCPRCGDFAVDLRHQAPGFAFGCRRCEHEWRWAPGTPWPVTVVRPRLGRR